MWEPTGGEARKGSRLPVERGAEEIRIRRSPPGAGVRELVHEELGAALTYGSCAVWIDLLRPREAARGSLSGELGLGPLAMEDCMAPLRMPKMDTFEGGVFVPVQPRGEGRHKDATAHLRAVEVDLVVGESYPITVRDGPVREIEDSVERGLGALAHGPQAEERYGEWLANAALDSLVDGHLPALVGVATVAEELEERLDPRNERASTAALENLILLRRDLSAFRRLAIA